MNPRSMVTEITMIRHRIVWSLLLVSTIVVVQLCEGQNLPLPRRLVASHFGKRMKNVKEVTPEILDQAFTEAQHSLFQKRKLERNLIRDGIVVDAKRNMAVARHQEFTSTVPQANQLEMMQEIFDETSKFITRNMSLTPAESALTLARIHVATPRIIEAVERCEEQIHPHCIQDSPYRRADGSCNNLRNPKWGKAFSCFARLLPPDYADGQSAPRVSVSGFPLPNPRIVSAVMHKDVNIPASYTHMVMQWGQFIAHDITFTPSSRTSDGQMIQCCPPQQGRHPQCFPIIIPFEDPFYSKFQETCLNFVRTAMCARCKLGPREQMNQVTSFIDASQVYGSLENETRSLWTQTGPAGKMHVSFASNGGELLPPSPDPDKDQCSRPNQNMLCFKAGDKRVNQHPALTALHVLWVRQHNRLISGLKSINPHWHGERLYEEAKRIVAAQMQMIIYNEYLPIVLGPDAMKFLKLNVLDSGYTRYDPFTDPTVLNEFSVAAFRFGHSLINSAFAEIHNNGGTSSYTLRENFFFPFNLYEGQIDVVLRGLVGQAAQNRDPYITQDVKNHLYRPKDAPYGLDLPAFNVQRGRDHGVPGYTRYLKFCFDENINSFPELDQYMPTSQRLKFQKMYRSVHDIDLFSGGLAEYPLPGAAVGPTFVCIIGIQFYNLKYGDRYFFEHGGEAGSFTPEQLQELRKTSLSKIICENGDNFKHIQRFSFKGESERNPIVPCNTIPDVDIRAWAEAPGFRI